ncbi:MAG: hypothetical protein HY753_01295 [Nitrospirae bacterium]|nr:hypothetical protein [Nitrospirota bacterium]
MLYRRELCNLKDPIDGKICLEIAGESLKNSEWTLVEGLRSAYYFDLDNFVCKRENAKKLIELLSKNINKLSEKFEFDKVALIDKGSIGPVGLIVLFGALTLHIEKEFIIVRPQKQLKRSAIKGNLNNNDRVLLLNDVATTGRTLFEAAEKIGECGGNVLYSLVVIDRCQGAITNLGRKGIELFSLTSAKSIDQDEDIGQKLKEIYHSSVFPDFEPKLVDFGGSIKTIAG